MKVSVDSILLGSWASVKGASNILDVGTGCGLLAIMCAQRNPEASILAIDIDEQSVEEAKFNFCETDWSDRLEAKLEDYNDINNTAFDLIISNPPFFSAGKKEIVTPREIARHQDTLSPEILLKKGNSILNKNGCLSMIVPSNQEDSLIELGMELGLQPIRILRIKGRRELSSKRVLMEFKKDGDNLYAFDESEIILESAPKVPTADFIALCKDFYINF